MRRQWGGHVQCHSWQFGRHGQHHWWLWWVWLVSLMTVVGVASITAESVVGVINITTGRLIVLLFPLNYSLSLDKAEPPICHHVTQLPSCICGWLGHVTWPGQWQGSRGDKYNSFPVRACFCHSPAFYLLTQHCSFFRQDAEKRTQISWAEQREHIVSPRCHALMVVRFCYSAFPRTDMNASSSSHSALYPPWASPSQGPLHALPQDELHMVIDAK